MDLDVKYLGSSFRIAGWTLLIMPPPAGQEGNWELDQASQALITADANWGMVLKVGDRAYEDNPGGCPYEPGDWVWFEDFHPQGRKAPEELVYFIPDTRILCALEEYWLFEPYLKFAPQLPLMAERAALKREELAERAIAMGLHPNPQEITNDIR